MTQPESKTAAEVVHQRTARSLAETIEQAAADCHSPREFLDRLAPIIRHHFGAWLAIASMPHRADLIAIDATDNGSMIDPELIRLQMSRSSGSSTAMTIRLADGRGARSLQVAIGEGTSAVGLGIVHSPERTPDSMEQLQQLRALAAASDAVYRTIHSIEPNQTSTAISTTGSSARSRLREFHRSLDTTETAMAVAAESAWMVDCDRVCVLLRVGSRFRLIAVTGVDVIDRRGNEPKCLERLAERAIAIQRPLIFPSPAELPPQVEEPLDAYLNQSLVQSGVLIPVIRKVGIAEHDKHSGTVIAAIVFERYRGQPIDAVTPAMQAVCEEALIAIENAQTHQSIFMLPVWKTAGKWLGPAVRHKTIAAIIVASLLLIASLVIQVEYKVTATGTVEPETVRNIFASADGVVSVLHARDGDVVKQGDLLVEIENAELRRQAEEIAGEIHSTTEKLASIDSVLVSGGNKRRDPQEGDQMTIDRRHLQTQLESLRAQQAVIVAEKDRQSLRSPIDGQVVGWRLSQRLEQRPVSRGHRLFAVVDTNGPKVLKLQVPDRDSGTVLKQSHTQNSSLKIDFVLATEPDRSLRAEEIEIASATRMDANHLNVLDVLASVDGNQMITANMGAEVTAAIHCGRRSLLATWFGDVASFYHRHVRFYFM